MYFNYIKYLKYPNYPPPQLPHVPQLPQVPHVPHVPQVPQVPHVPPIELNFRKSKWLLLPIYRPPSLSEPFFIDHLSAMIDYYSDSYENILTLGDFNMEVGVDVNFNPFIERHALYSLIKEPTCFKSKKGRCIDLILTNKKHSYFSSKTFETGMSDHHTMIYTIFKTTFQK